MNALPDLLFSDVDAMRLLGFNAYQIKKGLTLLSPNLAMDAGLFTNI